MLTETLVTALPAGSLLKRSLEKQGVQDQTQGAGRAGTQMVHVTREEQKDPVAHFNRERPRVPHRHLDAAGEEKENRKKPCHVHHLGRALLPGLGEKSTKETLSRLGEERRFSQTSES